MVGEEPLPEVTEVVDLPGDVSTGGIRGVSPCLQGLAVASGVKEWEVKQQQPW